MRKKVTKRWRCLYPNCRRLLQNQCSPWRSPWSETWYPQGRTVPRVWTPSAPHWSAGTRRKGRNDLAPEPSSFRSGKGSCRTALLHSRVDKRSGHVYTKSIVLNVVTCHQAVTTAASNQHPCVQLELLCDSINSIHMYGMEIAWKLKWWLIT